MTTPTEPTNEEPKPRLVQAPGDWDAGMTDEEKAAEYAKAPSARAQFHPRPHDGIWSPEQQREMAGPRASRADQIAAFEEYVTRPDIESRESILAREHAAPGQFSEDNVQSGAVDDGLVGPAQAGKPGQESEDAQAEADSVEDLTAYKG